MLTARTFAKQKGIAYPTVLRWLENKIVPGAALIETPAGPVWQIPASSLTATIGPRRGRKAAPKPIIADAEMLADADLGATVRALGYSSDSLPPDAETWIRVVATIGDLSNKDGQGIGQAESAPIPEQSKKKK